METVKRGQRRTEGVGLLEEEVKGGGGGGGEGGGGGV